MLKRFATLLMTMLLCACCILSCSAIEYDGVPHNDEWMESAVYSFENPDGFNNDVTFAYMRVFSREESNQLYFCFSLRVNEISDVKKSAVLLSFNDGEEIYLPGSGISSYDENLYNVEYGVAFDTGASNITYEVMLGVKHGIPQSSKVSVRLCDCNGVPSNQFGFDLTTVISNTQDQKTEEDEKTETTSEKESATKNKSSKTTKSSSKRSNKNNGQSNDFTFNRVDSEKGAQNSSQSVPDATSTVNLTQQVEDQSSIKKKVLTALGVLSSVAIGGCAVYSGIKKSNKKEDKE